MVALPECLHALGARGGELGVSEMGLEEAIATLFGVRGGEETAVKKPRIRAG